MLSGNSTSVGNLGANMSIVNTMLTEASPQFENEYKIQRDIWDRSVKIHHDNPSRGYGLNSVIRAYAFFPHQCSEQVCECVDFII